MIIYYLVVLWNINYGIKTSFEFSNVYLKELFGSLQYQGLNKIKIFINCWQWQTVTLGYSQQFKDAIIKMELRDETNNDKSD